MFVLVSAFTLWSGLMVIRASNPMHSVLFLILTFAQSALLLVMVHLDFFAMIFLVVYVGAIAVLFLFVVMILNIRLEEMYESSLAYAPLGGFLGLLFLFEIGFVLEDSLVPGTLLTYTPLIAQWIEVTCVESLQAVGNVLYTSFLYAFWMSSLILLVAMVGAIVMTLEPNLHAKRQDIYEQNSRECSKTILKYRSV